MESWELELNIRFRDEGRYLLPEEPEVEFLSPWPGGGQVRLSLERVYAWSDARDQARAEGKPEPSSRSVWMPQQIAAMELWEKEADALEDQARATFPAEVRAQVDFNSGRILDFGDADNVVVALRGLVAGPLGEGEFNHGVLAIFKGRELLHCGQPDNPERFRVGPAPQPRTRPGWTPPGALAEPEEPGLEELLALEKTLEAEDFGDFDEDLEADFQDPGELPEELPSEDEGPDLGAEFSAALLKALAAPEPEPEPQQEGISALGEWLARGWIELEEGADNAAIDQAMEALFEGPASKVLDSLFELPGVDEVYISDEELEEFLASW